MTYTHLPSGFSENILSTANSAQMVLPLPVGAPMRTFSALLYTALKTEILKIF